MDSIYSSESGISYCYDNGGVTFYCSDVYTCRDIDMASNVKRVCFGEDDSTKQMYYKLRYSCMIFPNVTEIYIARNVAAIEINNRMFPNCRKIVSNNVNYRSGSMLVKKDKAMDWNFLLNTFCLKKGEGVDLTGIDMIKSGAFSGCEIVEIKNVADLSQVEKYAFSDSDFCSDKNKAVGGFRMAGPIIVEMLPDLEEYEIPDYAIYTAPRAVKAMQKMHKAKRLIINNLAATVNVLCTTRLPKKVIVKNIKKRTDDTDYDLFDILDSETTERLLDKNACEEGYSIELEMMEVIPDLKSKVVIGDVLKTMINIFQLEEVSLDNLDPNIDYAAPATVLLSDGCSIRNKYTYTIPETNNYDLYVLPILGIMDEEIGAEFLEFSSFDEFLEKLSNIQKRQYPLGSDGSEWDDEDVTEDSSCDDGFNYMKSKKIYVLNPAWLHSDETGVQGLDSEYPE